MKKNWRRVLSLCILLALIMLAIVRCNQRVQKNQEDELIENLRAVTRQSALTIEHEVASQQERLLLMASEAGLMMDDGKSAEEIVEWLSTMNQMSGFKRVGFVDAEGYAYTTDGYETQLGFRDFYQRSMNGEVVLTSTLNDSIGTHEPINVFSAPVPLNDGSICGVVFATYRNETFQNLFDMKSLDTTGTNVIVDSQSNIVASSGELPFDSSKYSLFGYLESLGMNEQEIMADYYERIEEEDSQAYYYLKVNKVGNYYIYFEEIGMGKITDPWYIVNLVNEKTVSADVAVTIHNVTLMLAEIGILVVLAFLFFAFDIKRMQKKQRKEIEKLAFHDPLTGGENAAGFKDRVMKQERMGYLVSMDLHAFKMVNTVCGNERGDEILRSVYEWMREEIAPEDLIGHVSADRFLLFFPRHDEKEVLEKLTNINNKIVRETKSVDVPQLSAYFGITLYERGMSVEKALSDAGFARDSIHDKRNMLYSFFDKHVTDRIFEDKKMEDSFESAIENREFEVWYQPKFSPATCSIVGAEALVRWRRDGQLVPPGKFIPLFESDGLIRTLDEYVFREVCAEQKKLIDKGISVFPVSVNLSRASIYSVNVVDRYRQITDEVGIDPNLVPLEITESMAVDDDSLKALADEFHSKGFPLHMDDFGSGYSSLASLNRLHFDTLKLDKSLVDYIGNFGGDQLIKHTIALAKDLGMHVTAEGVENENQVTFLQEQNCDSIQGFYYSKPKPRDEYEQMIGVA
jgi:diguanylate cyclase (GGDEF)-like protein